MTRPRAAAGLAASVATGLVLLALSLSGLAGLREDLSRAPAAPADPAALTAPVDDPCPDGRGARDV